MASLERCYEQSTVNVLDTSRGNRRHDRSCRRHRRETDRKQTDDEHAADDRVR